MKRKIISYFLITSMLITILPFGLANAEDEQQMAANTVVFEEDFENSTTDITNADITGVFNGYTDANGFKDASGRTFADLGNDIEGYNGWGTKQYSSDKNPLTKTDQASSAGTQQKAQVVKVVKESADNNAGVFRDVLMAGTNAPYDVSITLPAAKQITSGKASVKLKVKTVDDKANSLNIALMDNKAVASPSIILDAKNKRVNGSATMGIDHGKNTMNVNKDTWTEVEMILDFEAKTTYLYIKHESDSAPVMQNSSKPWDASFTGLLGFSIGLSRNAGVQQAGSGFIVDDIVITKLESMDAQADRTADGDLNKILITLNNANVNSSITAESVKFKLKDSQEAYVSATAVTPVGTEGKTYEVTLPNKLLPETEYDIKLSEFKDKYGQEFSETPIPYTTRNKRIHFSEAKYYTTYTESDKVEAPSLTAGTITAEVKADNEFNGELKGTMIVVHKSGDIIKKASAVDFTVPAEKSEYPVTAPIAVTSPAANDKIEVYIWDSVTGGEALSSCRALAASSTAQAGFAESEFCDSKTADSINTNLAINPTTNGVSVSGNAKVTGATEITSLVLKPTYTKDTLTTSNFEGAVLCIGQKPSNADGTYSFDYTLASSSFADEQVYTAVTGTDGKLSTGTARYFDTTTLADAIAAVNASTPEQLLNYLNNSAEFRTGVYLNEVLQLNVNVYNTLKQPIEVCRVIAYATYSDISGLRTAFENAANDRKAKENRIDALLTDINLAAWDKIEAKLLADKTGLNDLALTWTGNYVTVSSNNDAKALFYQHLANDYTFTALDELQSAFVNEASRILTDLENEKKNNSSGGGGGGRGSSASFSGGYGKVTPPTPIVPVKEEVKIEFTDLESAPWAEEYITALAELGLINGVGDGKFGPDLYLTREQFVKMIVMALGLYDENAASADFIDVDEKHWSEKYVASAVEKGIVYGIDADHFGIGQRITRAEMAVMLHRAALVVEIDLPEAEELNYSDNADIPDYAEESVNIISKFGLMSGVGGNRFAPRDYTTRAMAAKVIYLIREAIQ